MKIYGPFHLLNNPLVMTSLALDAVTAGASLYNAYEQSHANDFLTASMLKGEPVTSLPGGPIRHLLSKLPGGVVSPDVQASPEQMLQEIGLLQQQRGEKLKEVGEYGKLRGEVGPGPFQAGGPFSSDLTRLTGSDTTFAGQTLPEQREAEAARQRDIVNERATPEYKAKVSAAEAQAKENVANEPTNLMAALSRKRAEGEASAEGRLAVEGSPMGLSLVARKADIATAASEARTRANIRAKDEALEDTPISELRSNKASGGVYVNKKTLKIATGASGEPKTKREADNNDDYTFVPNKDVDGRGGLKDTVALVNTIDKMLPLIDSTDIFPDTTGKNFASARTSQLEYGSYNYSHRSIDPQINRFYNLYAELIRYYTSLQGRYPNTKELSVPLVPDPGGLIPTGVAGSIMHLGGVNPLRVADSKAVARNKFMQMRETILEHFQAGSGIGTLDTDESALPDPGDIEPK